VILDPRRSGQVQGKISAYDDPIYIADAAIYLKYHDKSLGITNPYELNSKPVRCGRQPAEGAAPLRRGVLVQLPEADLQHSRAQRPGWQHWQLQYFTLKGKGAPVAASPASQGFVPKEGASGWSDTWMISSQAKHPNCMYMWMNWITSPMANAEVAQYFGEAPAQSRPAIRRPFRPQEGDRLRPQSTVLQQYHAASPGSGSGVYYWNTHSRTAATGPATARTTTIGSRRGPTSRGEMLLLA